MKKYLIMLFLQHIILDYTLDWKEQAICNVKRDNMSSFEVEQYFASFSSARERHEGGVAHC